jgi:hypothetical protein
MNMIDKISIILPLLLEILIWIGIIGGLIWIWKKRNWSVLKKAGITIIFAVGVFIAFIGLLAITGLTRLIIDNQPPHIEC